VTQEQDLHPLKTRIGDFIAGLKALEKEPITTVRVSEFVAEMLPSTDALAPYLLWSRERYTRNLIYRDSWFEVLALCWLPGQRTPIHSHNGQLGWLMVVQGELRCRNYRFVRSGGNEKKTPPRTGYDVISGRPVEVERLDSATFEADRRVAVVDRQQTTHQIENLEKSRYGSVSLHVYSKPIDSCVLFDEMSRCCERRRLQYYSAHGVVLENMPLREPQLTNAAA
jgi:cysteine dioxygenase